MDRKGGERGGGRDEKKHEQAVVRASALGDRRDGKPGDPALPWHLRARQSANDRRQRVNHEGGENAGEQT